MHFSDLLLEYTQGDPREVKKIIDGGQKVFVMYMGIQGSGKSTHAVKNFGKDLIILDHDEIAKKMSF
jgi:signal recognition particle GTPase